MVSEMHSVDIKKEFPSLTQMERTNLVNLNQKLISGFYEVNNIKSMMASYYNDKSVIWNAARKRILSDHLEAKINNNDIGKVQAKSQIDFKNFDEVVAMRYLEVSSNARRRGIDFSLSIADVKRMLSRKKCFYSGIKFDLSVEELRPSFDRVDNSLGYTKENVVCCITAINKEKNKLIEMSNSFFFKNPKLLSKVSKKWSEMIASNHLIKLTN